METLESTFLHRDLPSKELLLRTQRTSEHTCAFSVKCAGPVFVLCCSLVTLDLVNMMM